MGYCLNRFDEPVFMAVRKPMLTESGIHCILESYAPFLHIRIGKTQSTVLCVISISWGKYGGNRINNALKCHIARTGNT